jgi:hypothetical protein
MRNPFARTQRRRPFSTLLVELERGRARYLERCPDRKTTALEDAILINAVALEIGTEADYMPDDEEGRFVFYLIDEDGFIIDKDGKHMLPPEVREGKTYVELSGFGADGNAVLLVGKETLEPSHLLSEQNSLR